MHQKFVCTPKLRKSSKNEFSPIKKVQNKFVDKITIKIIKKSKISFLLGVIRVINSTNQKYKQNMNSYKNNKNQI